MKILIYSSLLLAALLTSCSKDGNPIPSNPNSKALVKSIQTIDFFGTNKSNYTYDSQRRISQNIITYEGSPDKQQTFKYEYTGTQVIVREYDASMTLKYTSYLNLNSKSLVDTSFERNGEEIVVHKYDSDMHLTGKKEYDQNNNLNRSQEYKYENGNLTSLIYYDESGNKKSSYEFPEYDLKKFNSMDNVNVGQSYAGKLSNNIPLKVVINSNGFSRESYIVYDLDNSGRVTKMSTYEFGSPTPSLEQNIEYY